MREVMETTYGFRHRKTGAFLRLERHHHDEDFSTGTSWTLTAEDPDAPLYESKRIQNLFFSLDEDTPWYNSTDERPSLGRLLPEDLIFSTYIKKSTYDEVGEEPVKEERLAFFQPLPESLPGKFITTRKDVPELFFKKWFGNSVLEVVATQDDENMAFFTVDVIRLDQEDVGDVTGMLFRTSWSNVGQVVAIAPVPEDWPTVPDTKDVHLDPYYKIALVRTGNLKLPPHRPFSPDDFHPETFMKP